MTSLSTRADVPYQSTGVRKGLEAKWLQIEPVMIDLCAVEIPLDCSTFYLHRRRGRWGVGAVDVSSLKEIWLTPKQGLFLVQTAEVNTAMDRWPNLNRIEYYVCIEYYVFTTQVTWIWTAKLFLLRVPKEMPNEQAYLKGRLSSYRWHVWPTLSLSLLIIIPPNIIRHYLPLSYHFSAIAHSDFLLEAPCTILYSKFAEGSSVLGFSISSHYPRAQRFYTPTHLLQSYFHWI